MFKYEKDISMTWDLFGDDLKKASNCINVWDNEFQKYLPKASCVSYKKYYKMTSTGPVRVKPHGSTAAARAQLPTLAMPCAESDEAFPGLYFIAMMGITPKHDIYYLVKVGQASDIQKRMKQYATHNPMIFHDHHSLRIDDPQKRNEYETNCHEWLATRAYAVAQNSCEWFYVNEKDYYAICNQFATSSRFTAVACGILA